MNHPFLQSGRERTNYLVSKSALARVRQRSSRSHNLLSVFKPEELDLLLDRSDLTWNIQKKLMEEKEEGSKRKRSRLEPSKPTIVKNANSIFKVIDTEGDGPSLPSVRDS